MTAEDLVVTIATGFMTSYDDALDIDEQTIFLDAELQPGTAAGLARLRVLVG